MFCIRVSNGVSGKHHSIGIGLEEPGSKKIRVTVTMRDRCYKKITLQVVSGIFVYILQARYLSKKNWTFAIIWFFFKDILNRVILPDMQIIKLNYCTFLRQFMSVIYNTKYILSVSANIYIRYYIINFMIKFKHCYYPITCLNLPRCDAMSYWVYE